MQISVRVKKATVKMSKKSTQIAIGGVFSSLCLLLMFMTGVIPFATYAMPAFAGAMLVAVVAENGRKTATLVYVSVSFLSLFIVPDREAAMIFIVFFGYYPIIKQPIERIGRRVLPFIIKLVLFNTAIVGGFLFTAHILGLSEILEGMGDFGRFSIPILLGAGNLVFILYDYILTKYTALYIHWFKPRFLRR